MLGLLVMSHSGRVRRCSCPCTGIRKTSVFEQNSWRPCGLETIFFRLGPVVLLLLDNWPLKGTSISGSSTRGLPTILEMSASAAGALIYSVGSLKKERDVQGSLEEIKEDVSEGGKDAYFSK